MQKNNTAPQAAGARAVKIINAFAEIAAREADIISDWKLYPNQRKGEISALFDNERYLTRGIDAEIPPGLQLTLWHMIDLRRLAKAELDYLQVFELHDVHGTQQIIHSQEQPAYRAEAWFLGEAPLVAKIYVIDDGDHSTMMLAEER